MSGGHTGFAERLRAGARAVEEALELLLPPAAAVPGVVHEAMRYSALGGGKRLRGIMVMEAAALAGESAVRVSPGGTGDPGAAGPVLTPAAMAAVGPVRAAAAAVEMLHAYSLVHDDLPSMDDGEIRHGKPTNHRVYGEAVAVLAGDALLTRAFEVMSRLPWAGCAAERAVAAVAELAVAGGTGGLIGGQVADIEAEGRRAGSEGRRAGDAGRLLDYIHAHKTGALFRASLRIGALLGGGDETLLEALAAYADAFGLAFQIADDLLDVEGDAELLGKGVGGDARLGKLTFPGLYGVAEARRMAMREVEKAKEAVAPLGPRASFLQELADFALARRR